MQRRIFSVVTLAYATILSGCSAYEGVYEPACIAFQGDHVTLADGRFVWDRFTDQVRVDEHGEVVDPFPNYPKAGRYELDDNRIELITDDGVYLDDHFFAERRDSLYLLTYDEYQAFLRDERVPGCGLKRSDDDN